MRGNHDFNVWAGFNARWWWTLESMWLGTQLSNLYNRAFQNKRTWSKPVLFSIYWSVGYARWQSKKLDSYKNIILLCKVWLKEPCFAAWSSWIFGRLPCKNLFLLLHFSLYYGSIICFVRFFPIISCSISPWICFNSKTNWQICVFLRFTAKITLLAL